jgi:iron complex outermembrane receptor protein
MAIIEKRVDERDRLATRMNLNARFEIVDGLRIGINTAYTAGKGNQRYYVPTTLESMGFVGRIHGRQSNDNHISKLLETTLSYDKVFNGIHNLNAVAGYSWQEDVNYGFNAQGGMSQSDFMGVNNLGALVNVMPGDIGSWKNMSNLVSFFGRAIYNYDQRYYFTGTLRRDGSSKFGANNKWGLFPSASVAWNIMREDFMRGIAPSWLDALRLRAGYGLAGNQDIPPYMSLTTYSIREYVRDPETDELVALFAGNQNPNPDLKWEINTEWNIGLDFGLWGGKLSGSFEYYDKTTSDLIARYDVPTPPNLYSTTFANGGSISNRGFEATFQFHAVRNRNVDWRTNLVFSTNRQVLVSLSSKDGQFGWNEEASRVGWVEGRGWVGQDYWTQLIREGQQLGMFYLPRFVDFSPDGAFRLVSTTGGVTREFSRAERFFAGSAMPKFEIGWSNYVTFFRHFDASMSMRAVVGHHVFNGTEMFFGNPWAIINNLNGTQSAVDLYNRGINPTAIGQTVAPSDYYLEKATFLRLDEVSIGYTLPLKPNNYVQRARISFTANNLLTLTGYSGLDPEVTYGGLSFGVENYSIYPRVRSFMFGVQLQF